MFFKLKLQLARASDFLVSREVSMLPKVAVFSTYIITQCWTYISLVVLYIALYIQPSSFTLALTGHNAAFRVQQQPEVIFLIIGLAHPYIESTDILYIRGRNTTLLLLEECNTCIVGPKAQPSLLA